MARSRNTIQLDVKAETNFDSEMIRIIIRKPYIGDIHPLDRKDVKIILDSIPPKYTYKLKQIEFIPRNGNPGKPWGQYLPSESKIILYSHPLKMEDGSKFALNMAFASTRSLSLLADLQKKDGKSFSVWTKEMLKLFYIEVILHEIGHHYTKITQHQKKMPIGKYHEILAETYKTRLLLEIESLSDFYKDKSEKDILKELTTAFIEKQISELAESN